MRTSRAASRLRDRGASSLELQVAFTVFAVSLVGLFPLASSQMKLTRSLESRVTPFDAAKPDATTHYLVPASNRWAGRMGVPATSRREAPETPPAALLNDSDPAVTFQPAGEEWEAISSGEAHAGDVHRHAAGDGTQFASWTFTGLQPGPYAIYVTWPAALDQASNVPVQINDAVPMLVDGADQGLEPALNQTLSPRADLDDGRAWQRLLHTYQTESGQIRVRLSTDASGPVVIDAVRVVPARREVQFDSLTTGPDGAQVLHATATAR